MTVIRAKKHLGQHFLKDFNIAQKIVNQLQASKDSAVVEIGPGTGVLTAFLLQKGFENLSLVEIDPEAVKVLKERFDGLEILQQDFLKMDLSKINKDNVSIIGNFPYNISSQIFFRILSHRDLVTEIVCMIQKEVAERLVSNPGTKVYGILSVLLQAYYNLEYLFTVGTQVFDPPPKVNSAVIRLTRKNNRSLNCDETLFFKLVKTAFNQRRKMLRNSLKSFLVNLPPDLSILEKRPEQLSLDEFTDLTRWIGEKQEKYK
jgi:16S rRNA (adenine1518-N6/adenine1519-N6)-dimethyltransferase